MKKLYAGLLIVLLAFAAACDRNDMLDFAENGGTTIYAVADDGASGMLLTVNDQGYYSESYITGMTIPAGSEQIYVDSDRRAYVTYGSILYYMSEEDSSLWQTAALPAAAAGIDRFNDTVYILTGTSGDCLHHLDSGTGTVISDSVSTSTHSPEFMDVYGDRIYISADNAGSSKEIYSSTGSGTATPEYSVPLTTTGYYFAVMDGTYYTGGDTSFFKFDTAAGTGTGMGSFALVSSSEIYAGALDANHKIKKLEGTTFTDVYTFPSTSGVIKIAPYKDGILAAAIYGSAADDGLYLFYTKSGSVKQISTRSVYSLFVR